MADVIEMELCANCKKEIPQPNYVMHMAHCARNITLCPVCKEPIPKNKFENHKKSHANKVTTPPISKHQPSVAKKSSSQQTVYKSSSIDQTSSVKTATNHSMKAATNHNSNLGATAKPVTNGNAFKPTSDYAKPSSNSLLACKYCDLELPKLDLEEHEDYCGTRTDKCIECGEFVMFKYKKLHEDSNHGFIKLNDEPGPKTSWDSNTQRSTTTSASESSLYTRRSRLPPLSPFDMTSLYNMTDYIPPSTSGRYGSNSKVEKSDSYKDMSRRLDSKTEYIKNLLHDTASITAPLRTGTSPRHYNHNKGPAPMPPSRRRNPPTELSIPCEFCHTPIPHEDLIQHETGCRPDLARFNPRRRSPEEDDYFVAPPPSSPEVELPCEFCADMFPASQLLRHQATCN